MHELALAEAVLDEVERQIAPLDPSEVLSVTVEIGRLSGVEPVQLEAAWQALTPGRLAGPCRLTLVWVPLRLDCHGCGMTFEPDGWDLFCPACGSGATQVRSGEAIMLRQIRLAEIPPAEVP